ncbi:hypothetical protein BX666DRAFT_1933316 [Dichotomocladium elegans]|nr:hypothetical protein BX666DRAFT_1933316 [Dichotomocladium elegans]
MPRSIYGGALYWSVPLTLFSATALYSISAKAKNSTAQPLRFVPSGSPSHDSENMERIRADWRERNHGIGLRDVSRSGGGV